jgi:hypothetical protein
LKKSAGSVQFQFYKPKTEKTELNQTQIRKKPSQTGFASVSVFFKKSVWLFFLIKTKPKIISPITPSPNSFEF